MKKVYYQFSVCNYHEIARIIRSALQNLSYVTLIPDKKSYVLSIQDLFVGIFKGAQGVCKFSIMQVYRY